MSDLHVGHGDHKERFHAIVEDLIFEKGDKAENYIIVITGDLVDDANNPGSRDDVKLEFDRLKEAGFKYILPVPGNHDYGSGDHGDKKFIKIFQKAFYEKEIEYPKLDIIKNTSFIGLDAMAEEVNWYDSLFAEGELGKQQLLGLEKILNTADVKSSERRIVYLHHHPFHWRPFHHLKDSNELQDLLTASIKRGIKIDAILYGHNHEGKTHNGKWDIPRCYDAGTATLKERPKSISWCPWFRVKASTRVIFINEENTRLDYELELL
jgi:3',5'-cyclic AMP phosphodiesterase CpdA